MFSTPMKMLSEADCQVRIRQAELALQNTRSQGEDSLEMAKIMMWERILYHSDNGHRRKSSVVGQ
jgi:hypothetical protein